jgi:hypothetical protein
LPDNREYLAVLRHQMLLVEILQRGAQPALIVFISCRHS